MDCKVLWLRAEFRKNLLRIPPGEVIELDWLKLAGRRHLSKDEVASLQDVLRDMACVGRVRLEWRFVKMEPLLFRILPRYRLARFIRRL